MYEKPSNTDSKATQTTFQVLQKFGELFEEAFTHDGFAEMRVEMRILRRGQKEVILHCGKQYRFVVDFVVDYLPSST